MVHNTELAKRLIELIRTENPVITSYMRDSALDDTSLVRVLRDHYREIMERDFPLAWAYYTGTNRDEQTFFKLRWRSFAFIRIMDYLDHEGEVFTDGNLHGEEVVSQPILLLRKSLCDQPCEASVDFLDDTLHLLRQLNGLERPDLPSRKQVQDWMERHPSGLDREVMVRRAANKERIIGLLIERIGLESTRSTSRKPSIYAFSEGLTYEQKRRQVLQWWREDRFHLRFAVRSTDELNRYLGNSLDAQTLEVMRTAEAKQIPIFATPYFLSLFDVRWMEGGTIRRDDEALRSYLFYSQDLVEEFGIISAWEKEDVVEPGKPNAAGWLLPNHSIHRRYPNVAIFIPSTMGRACGGLCSYCQRMYDFQKGNLNFNLDKLKPNKSWPVKLQESMEFFRNDPYLSDILITGGDALMSSVSSLKGILDAVLRMVEAKRMDNEDRPIGEKFAEFHRVRLGTKLPVYLPQRITTELIHVLWEFRVKAKELGVSQCIIQTHFSSAMEVTPESAKALKRLLAAGWAVTNQEVFTVAASRRGHTAKLRKVLNSLGVLPYYTFTVKGYKENRTLFANNSRSIQEQIEEKSIGRVDYKYHSGLRSFISDAPRMVELIDGIRNADEIPFLATDRNTLNLPGVGKSNTYRTIGITADGRRILQFELDHTRPHSPAVEAMGDVVVIESKSVATYMKQLAMMGEDVTEYKSIWGYSAGRLEPRSTVFEDLAALAP